MKKTNKGQVAIVVLLMSALMMTLGLSMLGKATVETKIDTNEESLKKAFNAAESGVSYYLGTGETDYQAPDGLSNAKIGVTELGVGTTINFKELMLEGSQEIFWLVNHDASGNIGNAYFSGNSVNVCQVGFGGSLEVSYYYRNGVNYGVRRYGYNFGNSETVLGFADAVGQNCVTINLVNNTPLLIVLTPIFDSGRFYLDSITGVNFPAQGLEISSVGKAGGAQAQVNKSISVAKKYQIPAFMLNAITSSGNVLSN
jgi:hypothetical protein